MANLIFFIEIVVVVDIDLFARGIKNKIYFVLEMLAAILLLQIQSASLLISMFIWSSLVELTLSLRLVEKLTLVL